MKSVLMIVVNGCNSVEILRYVKPGKSGFSRQEPQKMSLARPKTQSPGSLRVSGVGPEYNEA